MKKIYKTNYLHAGLDVYKNDCSYCGGMREKFVFFECFENGKIIV